MGWFECMEMKGLREAALVTEVDRSIKINGGAEVNRQANFVVMSPGWLCHQRRGFGKGQGNTGFKAHRQYGILGHD